MLDAFQFISAIMIPINGILVIYIARIEHRLTRLETLIEFLASQDNVVSIGNKRKGA